MGVEDIYVVTIAWARSAKEERLLKNALGYLPAAGMPVVLADAGSGAGFLRALRDLEFSVVAPAKGGLVRQVQAGIQAALRKHPEKGFILYTEPDKYPFFEGPLMKFVSQARTAGRFGVTLAARDAKSFRTFPKGQRWTEAFMNEAAELMLGKKGDYCYGPLLLSRRVAEMALEAPADLGWGWRFWVMGRAQREGLLGKAVTMGLPCPREQRGENSKADRMYRLEQLGQNLEGLRLGLAREN